MRRHPPEDPYGVSKLEAEQGLCDIETQTGMEVAIVRPPLVYGPGVKANFAAMMRWVARVISLPWGAIHNARSMVALDNLVDLLVTCLKNPSAAGQIFLVSDGQDVSTTVLLRRTAKAMGKSVAVASTCIHVLIERNYAEKEFERKCLMNQLNDLLCEAINLSKTKCGIESKCTRY